jgi:O-antigen ligase
MKAPVWFVLARMGQLVGGDAFHRSALIDAAIKHFNEWWLFGTKDTTGWGLSLLQDGDRYFADITNQFIRVGVNGGILSMILFIIIIIMCFRQIGISLRLNERQPFGMRIILWSLGVSLFVNVIAFFSVSYFDQIFIAWFMLLAMISSTCIQKQNSSDLTI